MDGTNTLHFDGRIEEFTWPKYWIFSQHANVGERSQHPYPYFYPLPADHDQYNTDQYVQNLREKK